MHQTFVIICSWLTIATLFGIHESHSVSALPYNQKTSSPRSPLPLRRYMLQESNVTCNDGTRAGFYFRPSPSSSRRWIVFLEGGWYCFSDSSCHQRWLQMRNLMSSAHWPKVRNVGGILSPTKGENPYFWNYNHVFVPYCSSDSWSGASPAKTLSDLAFLGSEIIDQVILELTERGLYDGKMLLLAGSSAGAGGVLVNLDRIAETLYRSGSKVEVRGIIDSGWFLDNEPFNPEKDSVSSNDDGGGPYVRRKRDSDNSSSSICSNPFDCSPIDSIKLGMKLWNGQVPRRCRDEYPMEPWRCYFGYRMYPTLKSPLFVFQWIYDEAQMMADNVAAPISRPQWEYVYRMGQELRKTLANVTSVFAPSCISHIVLTKSSWNSIAINGTTLPMALKNWEMQKNDFYLRFHEQNRVKFPPHDRPQRLYLYDSKSIDMIGPQEILKIGGFAPITPVRAITTDSIQISKRDSKRRHKKHKKHRNVQRRKRLAHRKTHLIDSCSSPQCNSGCPRLVNPITGEMM